MPNLNVALTAGVDLTTTNGDTTVAATFATETDAAYLVSAKVVAVNTGSYADSGGYLLMATFLNDGGTLSRADGDAVLSARETGAAGAWGVDVSASGTNIVVRVAGEPAKTVKWHVDTEIYKIK